MVEEGSMPQHFAQLRWREVGGAVERNVEDASGACCCGGGGMEGGSNNRHKLAENRRRFMCPLADIHLR